MPGVRGAGKRQSLESVAALLLFREPVTYRALTDLHDLPVRKVSVSVGRPVSRGMFHVCETLCPYIDTL
jgi:hypothetical protein